MAGKSPAERFHTNLLVLCDQAAETLEWAKHNKIETKLNPGILNLAKILVSSWDPKETIDSFIQKSASYWDQILHRDKKFLIENAEVLFQELPTDYINSFKELFETKTESGEYAIPDEILDSFWEILQAMVRISIRHIHHGRKPVQEHDRLRYTVEFFPSISVKQSMDKWKMTKL